MKTQILGILGGIALLLAAGSVYAGSPRPVKYLAASGCTFISTGITFDGGINFASEDTCTSNDNFGFPSTQGLSAYYDTLTTCTAPDGTPGELFGLEFSTFASTYLFVNDQIWTYSFDGSICASDFTGAFAGSTTYTTYGGTGRFTGATGTSTFNATGSYLDRQGNFGRYTSTGTGTITP